MGWNVKVTLFRCATCKKTYNNRLTHVCRVRFSQATGHKLPGAARKTRRRAK